MCAVLWHAWRVHTLGQAVIEAEKAGLTFTKTTPFTYIRNNWSNAFNVSVWKNWRREFKVASAAQIRNQLPLILRAEPNSVQFTLRCNEEDFEALASIPGLQRCHFPKGGDVTDISKLAKLPELTFLQLSEMPKLRSITPLSRLAKLQGLTLEGIAQLDDISALANLQQLRSVELASLPRLKEFSPLKSLKSLTYILRFLAAQEYLKPT